MAMDFISGPTTTNNNPPTPDSDTDTPPHPPPSKRTHHLFNHHDHHQHVSYKECLKNHAASIGGHALDGCCEFMPGPTFNPFDPTSLICAACGCHRNFHRRDPDDPTPIHHLPPTARKAHSPPSASQLLLSLSGHGNSPSGPSDHGGGQNGNFSSSKKRFRTKFSQEQKEKMQEFSEKIGWRLKRGEERLVEEFCKQVCVDRNVFKVWMHNNKHSSSSTCGGGGQRREKVMGINDHDNDDDHKINTITINSNNAINGNHGSNNNNNVGLNNCGGVLGTSKGLEFNFANGGGQEAKAQ